MRRGGCIILDVPPWFTVLVCASYVLLNPIAPAILDRHLFLATPLTIPVLVVVPVLGIIFVGRFRCPRSLLYMVAIELIPNEGFSSNKTI